MVWLHTKSYLLDFSNNDIFASCYLLSLTRSSKRRDVFCENIQLLLSNRRITGHYRFCTLTNEQNILVQIFCGQDKETLKYVSDVILNYLPQAICIGTTTDGEINESITTLQTIISISIFDYTTLKTAYSNDEDSLYVVQT